jgi:D-proline reductase (dithiol) PrdB
MGEPMDVDSYKWLPRRLAEVVRAWRAERLEPIPWAPLPRPLEELRLCLVTTAGIYVEGRELPFDAERERREPTWGDPSYRTIPRDAPRQGIAASHLHVNNDFVRRDINVALPLDHAEVAVADGLIASLAATHYSFMGFQLDTGEWERRYAPEVAERMRAEQVDVALLTPV